VKEQVIVDAINAQGLIASDAARKITELYNLLRTTCSHPKIIFKESYSEGSYYDREEWITEEICTYCQHNFGIVKRTIGGYG
jgi:hypothetical protein